MYSIYGAKGASDNFELIPDTTFSTAKGALAACFSSNIAFQYDILQLWDDKGSTWNVDLHGSGMDIFDDAGNPYVEDNGRIIDFNDFEASADPDLLWDVRYPMMQEFSVNNQRVFDEYQARAKRQSDPWDLW